MRINFLSTLLSLAMLHNLNGAELKQPSSEFLEGNSQFGEILKEKLVEVRLVQGSKGGIEALKVTNKNKTKSLVAFELVEYQKKCPTPPQCSYSKSEGLIYQFSLMPENSGEIDPGLFVRNFPQSVSKVEREEKALVDKLLKNKDKAIQLSKVFLRPASNEELLKNSNEEHVHLLDKPILKQAFSNIIEEDLKKLPKLLSDIVSNLIDSEGVSLSFPYEGDEMFFSIKDKNSLHSATFPNLKFSKVQVLRVSSGKLKGKKLLVIEGKEHFYDTGMSRNANRVVVADMKDHNIRVLFAPESFSDYTFNRDGSLITRRLEYGMVEEGCCSRPYSVTRYEPGLKNKSLNWSQKGEQYTEYWDHIREEFVSEGEAKTRSRAEQGILEG